MILKCLRLFNSVGQNDYFVFSDLHNNLERGCPHGYTRPARPFPNRGGDRLVNGPHRKHTIPVRIGSVTIGGDHPIAVQSMTNTDTADVKATIRQVSDLIGSGSELVRITVNTPAAAAAVPRIVAGLRERGLHAPIIGDFHYNGHILLPGNPECAQALDKYRINPGNVGKRHRDEHFARIIETALEHGKAVRIGVNWGSLDQALLALAKFQY